MTRQAPSADAIQGRAEHANGAGSQHVPPVQLSGPPPLPTAEKRDGRGAPLTQRPGDAHSNGKAPESTVQSDDNAEYQHALAWLGGLPSWLVSMVVHLALLLGLALVTSADKLQHIAGQLFAEVDSGHQAGELTSLETKSFELDQPPAPLSPAALPEPGRQDPLSPSFPQSAPSSLSQIEADAPTKSGAELIGEGFGGAPGSIEGRLSSATRAHMLISGGGSAQSEQAVSSALAWLAEHQCADGSWNFDLRGAPKCRGRCKDSGHLGDAKFAATAMALLPFLGSGQTHLQGEYKKNIQAGLYFLVRMMRVEGEAGSMYEPLGQMYGHGLASIVLCEAYGMTHDNSLKEPAQAAVNFIVMAQDPRGGGWRYSPGQPGDTSVVGWQLMALKSAQMAYLKVPEETMRRADAFLDDVSDNRGATFGYNHRGNRPATSAIGLLCRMYLGRKLDDSDMTRGIQLISKAGPAVDRSRFGRNRRYRHGGGQTNMYYNYYATQVMHHAGGDKWKDWNSTMRDYLIDTQQQKGHEEGSWYFDGDEGSSPGGRLYCTSLAAMTLEVYYRHMPLYTGQSTRGGL